MNTSNDLPPNYDQIAAAFDLSDITPVFTYGDTMYNVQEPLPEHLIAHERVHSRQQTNPEEWWDRYLRDPEFRLSQEVEAYGAQYAYACQHLPNKALKLFLFSIASDLSGAMYGNILTHGKAQSMIRRAAKHT